MQQKQIIQQTCRYINYTQQNGATISSNDYSQDRKSFMIVVGITNVEQIYPTLPDYKYTMSIVVDCFIADDINGTKTDQLAQLIEDKMNKLIFKQIKFSEVFGEIPIVGILNKSKQFSISQDSNRVEFSFELFGSF